MRFDDSLETVLAADMSSAFGVQSAWRQLVDLIGRGRVPASPAAMARLRTIRARVSPPVRAASARAIAQADPPAPLVALFAEDEIAIAAPVLRMASIEPRDWIAMLPGMSPATRSVLRHRRDLAPEVQRALESFGSVDFVLATMPPATDLDEQQSARDGGQGAVASGPAPASAPQAVPDNPAAIEAAAMHPLGVPPATSFVSLSSIARNLPVVAEAMRQSATSEPTGAPSAAGEAPVVPIGERVHPVPSPEPATGTFQIAELVARIDAYQRQREDLPAGFSASALPEVQRELFALDPAPAQSFRFETDAAGVVRWVEGAARAPLIGLSLDLAATPGSSRVDGVAAGAFRRRAGFTDARLVVEGSSDAAGPWRITGLPVFDRASGRFTGYRGAARRPRVDEVAELSRESRNPASDALRQLVHELRTPANAIAGFAELIESQLLGPVPQPYRAHAAAIRSQTHDLLGAIDDIDMAARIESDSLDLRPGEVALAPLLARIADDLAPLAQLRGCRLIVDAGNEGAAIAGDDRAVERLIARLMATIVSSGAPGERITVVACVEGDQTVALAFDRPRALGAYGGERLLTIDAETEAEREGAPLLGTGFALRLARNLAVELGGSLTIGEGSLTLRLPAAFLPPVEQVSRN